MGYDLMDVFVKIGADTSALESGLENAKNMASGFGSAVSAGVKGAGVAIAAVGTAVMATGASLVQGTSDLAAYGDNIDKMSQKMGISAQGYQEWEAVMQHSGTSMETLKSGMKTLANAVEKGNESFERLGITQEQIASMNQEELFNTTISALQNVEDETERTYLAGQLLGKGATELGALLNTSAEDTQAMKDRVHELGGVLSDDAVKAAAAYQDQLQDMQTAFQGLSRNMLTDFMPALTDVMGGLTEIFTGNYDAGISQISEGINSTISTITDKLPQALEVGGNIVEALAQSLVENAPKVLPALTDLVMDIGTTIGDLIPDLIDVGVQLVETVGSSLVENAPAIAEQVLVIGEQLAGAALELMQMFATGLEEFDFAGAAQNIVDFFTDAFTGDGLSTFLETGMQIVTSIVNGIFEAGPIILEGVESFITGFTEGLSGNVTMLLDGAIQFITSFITFVTSNIGGVMDTGADILSALIDGILGAIPTLVASLPTIIEALISGFTENLPRMIEIGLELMVQVATGLISAIPEIVAALPEIVQTIIDGFANVDWLELGIMVIEGVINGAQSIVNSLITTITKIADNVLNDWIDYDWVKMGIQLITDVVDGIAGLINSIPEKIQEIINNVITLWQDTDWLSIGTNVVQGIWDGISGGLSWIKERIEGWVGDVFSFLKKLFKIESPSKLMRDEIGLNIAKGVALGIEAGTPEVLDAMSNMEDLISEPVDASVSVSNFTALGDKEDSIDYNEMAYAFVKALEKYGLTVEIDHREFGRIVRKEVMA